LGQVFWFADQQGIQELFAFGSCECARHWRAIVSCGSDSHIVLEAALERAGLTCNKDRIPFDAEKPGVTSGIRLRHAFGTAKYKPVADLIALGLTSFAKTERKELAELNKRRVVVYLHSRVPTRTAVPQPRQRD
jgi:glycine/serine hydroxymethyltransferase